MNRAVQTIAGEIHQRGAISFARFMELALYCPLCGYYEQEADKLGRRGDYFTSVSVGNLFGELLAFRFAGWLTEPGATDPANADPSPRIIEAGAHDGRLARDILAWLRERRPNLFAGLRYGIVEPSDRRRAWQRRRLAEFGDKVGWHSGLASLRSEGLNSRAPCVIFSNELLDALPVHRVGWDARAKAWFEWGVALEGERFIWVRLPRPLLASRVLPLVPEDLQTVLPDGFTTEVCPAAADWWQEAASVLPSGRLLALDYGLTAEEFLAPHRRTGTLRAYRAHRVSDDVLADPGEQDLTAHVNFTAIQVAGETVGLRTESLTTQAQFLVSIAEQTWRAKSGFGDWDAARLRQFKTLTHPEHLGRPFRVVIQRRES